MPKNLNESFEEFSTIINLFSFDNTTFQFLYLSFKIYTKSNEKNYLKYA